MGFHCFRGRTPVGRSVLEKYLGFVPPLPALVMSQLKTGGEVFLFPPERLLMAKNILQWIQDVENGQEQPAGKSRELVNRGV